MAKKKSDFIRGLLTDIDDNISSVAADGLGAAEYTGYIDTGSLALNALLCGDVNGGVPNNKVVVFAGESAVGKTYFVLGIIKHFLDTHEGGVVVYYDTEAAVTKKMMEERGVDTTRVIISEPLSIQQFRTHAVNVLDSYVKTPEKDRPPLMMALDSLGALSTDKEIKDTAEGSDTRDMTRAQLIRGAFRVLRLKLAKSKVPMLVTNHTYAAVGCVTAETRVVMSDGSAKEISSVEIGEIVQTLLGPKLVEQKFEYDFDTTYEIELEDGVKIRATGNHKFLTQDLEWKTLEELREDDSIVFDDTVTNKQ